MEGERKRKEEFGTKEFDFLQKIGFQPCSNTSRNAMLTLCGPNALPSKDQLTFFYGGRVFVFDGINDAKAREIMHIASTAASNANHFKQVDATATGSIFAQSFSLQNREFGFPQSQTRIQPMSIPNLHNFSADLPIARRHSLQRFLEKRRDRIVSQSPYHEASKKTPGGSSDTIDSASPNNEVKAEIPEKAM